MVEKAQKQADRATMADLEPGEWGIVDAVGGEGARQGRAHGVTEDERVGDLHHGGPEKNGTHG